MSHYDSMYWTDKPLPDEVYNELRLSGIVHTGLLIRDAWVKRGELIGLPRNWAKNKDFSGFDATSFPRLDWPCGTVQYRYNQREVIECASQRIRTVSGCLISAPPGFGKTVVSLEVASRLHTPTLVLVNKEDLINQWKDTAKRFFGLEAGHIQENRLDYEKRHVSIATVQTLSARFDRIPLDFWSHFGFVICDESHRMPCETFVKVISALTGRYRLGVSATWRRKDGMEALWRWHIGEDICEGEKADIPFRYQRVTVETALSDRDFYQRGEINHTKCLTAIARCEDYNQWLVETIIEGMSARNILLVSHRLEQLERIDAILRTRGVFPGIYVGKWKGKTLTPEQLREASEMKVILGTYGKIGEGSDLPRLDTLIMATPCTDPTQVTGRIGRAYPGKKFALVIDPVVKSGYCESLFKKREQRYLSDGYEKL